MIEAVYILQAIPNWIADKVLHIDDIIFLYMDLSFPFWW